MQKDYLIRFLLPGDHERCQQKPQTTLAIRTFESAILASGQDGRRKMKKFWKGFRKPDHLDEEKIRTRKEILGKLQRIIHEGRHEAEQEFVDLMKELIPTISKEELLERIR